MRTLIVLLFAGVAAASPKVHREGPSEAYRAARAQCKKSGPALQALLSRYWDPDWARTLVTSFGAQSADKRAEFDRLADEGLGGLERRIAKQFICDLRVTGHERLPVDKGEPRRHQVTVQDDRCVRDHDGVGCWQLKATLVAGGVDVEPLLTKGQLVILTAKDAYLRDGEFDPDKMIALVRDQTEKALAEGYPALRATGEMTWALAGEPGSERLVEYESKLNEFFPGSKCYAICQYDRRRFDAEMLLDILHTHPRVLHGKEAYDNSRFYFVPPDSFLGTDRPNGVLDRLLANLAHHHIPE